MDVDVSWSTETNTEFVLTPAFTTLVVHMLTHSLVMCDAGGGLQALPHSWRAFKLAIMVCM